MDRFPEGINSKFQYVMLVARRAEELMQGSMPRRKSKHAKPSRIAMDEIHNDLVNWAVGDEAAELNAPAAEEEVLELE